MTIHCSINSQALTFSEEGSATGNGNIVVGEEKFNGTVRRAGLEPGLSIYFWDFVISQPVDFGISIDCSDEEKVYILHYHLHPQYHRLEYSSEGRTHSTDRQQSTFVLLRCPGQTVSVYKEATTLHRLSIVFSHQWLLSQLRDVRDNSRASDYILQMAQTVAERALSKGEIALVQFLADAFRGQPFLLEVKAYVYHLVSFLYRQVSMMAHREASSAYGPVMMKVEKRIMASLYTHMPTLEELARESFISVSTLKRQFKEVFGLSVYDYYLAKKMDLARQLLEQGNLPVNAVAFQLSYESLSHFTNMFKKIHGYPPGKARHKKA